ncbi:MAG TPA: cupin domain-containing protein [Actinomycetota bacterium]|nr:cupin domain-containing protein [Actinomycetota bacterium]
MTDPDRYFAQQGEAHGTQGGRFVDWDALDVIEMLPGLTFQPVLGDRLMVNFVRLEPNTEAPLHWHEEEQISIVIDGEFEFEVGGEKQIVRRGQAVVIPSNVPHGARTYDNTCLELDVFYPPRKGLLEAMGVDRPEDG